MPEKAYEQNGKYIKKWSQNQWKKPPKNHPKNRSGKNNARTKNAKQICERPLLSQSEDRDREFSGLYKITVKWLRTRVGHPCIDTLVRRDTQIDTDTYADRQLKIIHQHAQIRLPSRLWILFLMLFVSMSPNFCRGGAWANAHSLFRPNPNPNHASHIM